MEKRDLGGKRKVSDSMGELEIEDGVLFGAQTQRAINNFPISGIPLPVSFIRSLILIKLFAAKANSSLGCLDSNIAVAISDACETLLEDENLMTHFPVDVFQTGSGTSSNMNANEVIATLAKERSNLLINPNDHVNFGQSSNDVIPTAIHMSTSLLIKNRLLPSLKALSQALALKAEETKEFCKTGRTHLMDAMPIRLDQTLYGWEGQIANDIHFLEQIFPSLNVLALGGTAVGTGINTHPDFSKAFMKLISERTGIPFRSPANYFPLMSSQDTVVALLGNLKTTAVSIMKIANDLRWMNSGPLAGLGEISLEALQPGSSIMPGKVNPVIPEAAAMVAAEVIGNDASVTIAGQSGNFELNVMLPLIAHKAVQSIELLSNISFLLADKCIKTFVVNAENLNAALHRNPILVTALNPVIGYAKAAEIAKRAYKENRPIIEVAEEETDISRSKLEELLDPMKLTHGGL